MDGKHATTERAGAHRAGSPGRTGWAAASVLCCALAAAACGAPANTSGTAASGSRVQAIDAMNPYSASAFIELIAKAGLPVPNPRDMTAQDCPKIGCTDEEVTDAVTVTTYLTSGRAQRYAGELADVFQIENVVLRYPAGLPAAQRQAYQAVVTHALQ